MGLKVTITIDGAKRIEQGLWKATLKPEEAATLGDCKSRSGPFSVLMLESACDYDLQTQSLTFDPNASRLLPLTTPFTIPAQMMGMSGPWSPGSSRSGSPIWIHSEPEV